ncbi:hypothetical protein BASA81_008878 [Batrachochytrium salamandrivorans]|nr:hypothetical protein BASA81_008878 [Batrachochytrium salamandrivorans]
MLHRINVFLGGNRQENDSWLLPLIHLNLMLFSFSFWMQQPLLSVKFEQLNGTEVEFGTLQSATAVSALLGSAAMGRVIDTLGNRQGLILAQLASATCILNLALATNVQAMFLSVLPAFFQHGMLASQAFVGSVSENKSLAFGRLALSYGVGMSLGSPLGSVLASRVGMEFALWCAFAVALGAVGMDLILLPSTVTGQVAIAAEPRANLGLVNQLAAIYHVATSSPEMGYLLTMLFVGSVGPQAFRAMLPVVFVEQGYGELKDLGFFMSYTAVLMLISNVFVVGPVVNRMGESYSLLVALLVASGSFFTASFWPQWVYVLQVPQTIAFSFFYTVSSGLMSRTAKVEDQGTVNALGHATRSFNQVVAPILGGYVMRRFGFAGVRLLAAGSLLCSAGVGLLYIQHHKQRVKLE